MKFAHAIKTQQGREVKTRCGVTLRFKGGQRISRCTAWESEVTCKKCKKLLGHPFGLK